MKVILLKTVQKLGKKDQIVEVPEGYARNALFPKGLAVQATDAALMQHAARIGAQEDKRALEKHLLEQAYQQLAEQTISLSVAHTKEGVLFKKVVAKDIAVAILESTRLSIDPADIVLGQESFKQAGEYTVSIRAYPQYSFTLSIV